MSATVLDIKGLSGELAAAEREQLPERLQLILDKARERAAAEDLRYAGGLRPSEAYALFSAGHAFLVDVRTAEERKFVGHVPGTLHVAWMTGTAMTKNPRFLRELESKVKKDALVLLLCRSGKRSAAAADVAAAAGFENVFNVLEGFEGDYNDRQQRRCMGGWTHYDLPWIQD
ncbi:MAG: rhodanese-like domain-containing protein [Proteobacteria bacterium]|nr:rhodanese-like domain-containing protein [Pseudomonadota bacterium]